VLDDAFAMKRGRTLVLVALALSACGRNPPSDVPLVRIKILSTEGRCAVESYELECSGVSTHLRSLPGMTSETPLGVTAEVVGDAENRRIEELASDLAKAGFRKVAFVTVRQF
jgi:hypothetical protein